MPFLTYLDPASVDPTDLVNRDRDVRWLRASLESFFRDRARGRALAILGDRGIGKSIVMRRVIDSLREVHGGDTLFLVIDCRRYGDQRRVYHEIARLAVDQIGPTNRSALLDTARILETIAKFDEVERRVLSEHVTGFKAALTLKGEKNLLRLVGTIADVSVEQSKQRRETLEGKIFFDATRLRDAVVAFFSDLRAAGLDVVLVLDNLDELRHEALGDDEKRRWLHGEIDGLLGLASAPIGLVVTARTYFAGCLNRQIDNTKVLGRLDDAEHVAIIRRRLQREAPEVQRAFEDERCGKCIERLAKMAPTPLALLSWFRYLAENELHADEPREGLKGWLRDRYAHFRPQHIDALVSAFGDAPTSPVPGDVLLKACGDNQALWQQVLRSQIVLPIDFWHPHEFTLAPELHFLCGSQAAE